MYRLYVIKRSETPLKSESYKIDEQQSADFWPRLSSTDDVDSASAAQPVLVYLSFCQVRRKQHQS